MSERRRLHRCSSNCPETNERQVLKSPHTWQQAAACRWSCVRPSVVSFEKAEHVQIQTRRLLHDINMSITLDVRIRSPALASRRRFYKLHNENAFGRLTVKLRTFIAKMWQLVPTDRTDRCMLDWILLDSGCICPVQLFITVTVSIVIVKDFTPDHRCQTGV